MDLKLDGDRHVVTNICFVCGFDLEEPFNQHDDCPCCGIHVNYWSVDPKPKDTYGYRDKWINRNNFQYDAPTLTPEGWNKEMALKQIMDNVPEEFWKDDPLFKEES